MKEDDIIAQIETDKVTIDVKYTGKQSGVITALHIKEQDVVEVGKLVCEVDTAATPAAAPACKPAPQPPKAPELPKEPKVWNSCANAMSSSCSCRVCGAVSVSDVLTSRMLRLVHVQEHSLHMRRVGSSAHGLRQRHDATR